MVKKVFKIITIYLTFTVLSVIISSCGGEAYYYNVNEMHSRALRLEDIITETDYHNFEHYSTIQCNNLLDTVAIRFDSIGFEVTIEYEELIAHYIQSNKLSFIQSCHADETVSFEKIVDIKVYSNKDYSQNYPKGSNLSMIMNIAKGNSTNGVSFKSYLLSYHESWHNVLLRFISPPDVEQVHTFTIKYITENGNEFETKQEQLLIKK